MANLRVLALNLPRRLPSIEAITSFPDTTHSYEPEFWEFQYLTYRYLERAPNELLYSRYSDIRKNMDALISAEREVIPIQSFLSSWYWFRKEHQTRLEFALRSLDLPMNVLLDVTFNNNAHGAPVRPKHPNSGDVLFRYDKLVHLNGIAYDGVVRLRPATDFSNLAGDDARQDEERSKTHYMAGGHTRITTEDGKEIPVLGDVERTVSMPNYYVFCMSCDWDIDLFSDFNGDACLVVENTNQFASCLERAFASEHSGWCFHHNPVQYYDPYERTKNEYFDAGMSKDFKFAYQREYRFLWFPQNSEQPDGFVFLNAGNLSDMATVYTQQGTPADRENAARFPAG